MKGLLLRLSVLDADAATALRVIAHFEALLGGRLEAASLVRSTAGLAECPAGLRPAEGRTERYGPDGAALAGEPERISGSADLDGGGQVWLERPGTPGPFDELVLEWMAIAAQVLDGRPRDPQPPQVADPALVERVLSGREAVEDRARALRLLGLTPDRPLRVVAVAGPEAVALLGRGSPETTVRVAAVGRLGVALAQPHAAAPSPAEDLRALLGSRAAQKARVPVRIGIGGSVDALDARTSWAQARLALRFAVPGDDAVVDHDSLGTVALLAEIPGERLRTQPDVRALEELAPADTAALATFCRTGSLRHAATELHLHHSSVATRLARVEQALGLRLSNPEDRFRARLALHAHHLANTSLLGD